MKIEIDEVNILSGGKWIYNWKPLTISIENKGRNIELVGGH